MFAGYMLFWEGDLVLRDIIPINDSFTLRPRSEAQCKNFNVKCTLKKVGGADVALPAVRVGGKSN